MIEMFSTNSTVGKLMKYLTYLVSVSFYNPALDENKRPD